MDSHPPPSCRDLLATFPSFTSSPPRLPGKIRTPPPKFSEFSQGEHTRNSTLTQKQNVPSPWAPPCQGKRFADLCHWRFALPGFELLKTGISLSSFASDLMLHCNCETTHVGTRSGRGPSHTSGHLPVGLSTVYMSLHCWWLLRSFPVWGYFSNAARASGPCLLVHRCTQSAGCVCVRNCGVLGTQNFFPF